MKILIIDAYSIVELGYRTLLASDPDLECHAARDARAGYACFVAENPDVTLVDFHLTEVSGLELMRRMLMKEPKAAVILVSGTDDPLFATQALDAGARGFLSKHEEPATILQSIRDVAAGGVSISASLAKRMVALRSREGEAALRLTPREREILRLLSIGRNMAEIADLIDLSYKTVAVSCNRLRGKLHARTTVELVHVASMLGLL